MAFEIGWTIESEHWNEASAFVERASADWARDSSSEVIEGLLPGWIRFGWNGEHMVPVPLRDNSWADFSVRRHGLRLREFAANESHLAQEYSLWVAEFAWQLANALNVEKFETAPDGADAWYHMFDEPLSIRFHKSGGDIAILSDEREDLGWMLLGPNEKFFVGVKTLLGSFAAALGEHVPDLLGWEVFKGLLPYLPETRKSE